MSTPERSARARIAALRKASTTDGLAATANARRTFLDNFVAEIRAEQPELTDPVEIVRRADARRREHMARLSYRRWHRDR